MQPREFTYYLPKKISFWELKLLMLKYFKNVAPKEAHSLTFETNSNGYVYFGRSVLHFTIKPSYLDVSVISENHESDYKNFTQTIEKILEKLES